MLVIPYEIVKYKTMKYWIPLHKEAKDTLYRPYNRPMNPLIHIFSNIQW